jgi:hypothetical protein
LNTLGKFHYTWLLGINIYGDVPIEGFVLLDALLIVKLNEMFLLMVTILSTLEMQHLENAVKFLEVSLSLKVEFTFFLDI